jgi:hypothetical protein
MAQVERDAPHRDRGGAPLPPEGRKAAPSDIR